MNILAPFIAGLAIAHAGNHWHQQLKPFANGQEFEQAFKEELAHSSFTAHWSQEDKKRLETDPAFLQFSSGPYAVSKALSTQDWSSRLFLRIPQNSSVLTARNRAELKTQYLKIADILAHEGAHLAQGDVDVDIACGSLINPYSLKQISANLASGNFDTPLPQFYRAKTTKNGEIEQYNPNNDTFLIVQDINSPTHLITNSSFMQSFRDLHQGINDYEKNRLCFEKEQTSQLRETLSAQLGKISDTLFTLSREIETDADKHSYEAIINDTTLSSYQKLQTFINSKKHLTDEHNAENNQTNCNSLTSEHPPCSERIAMIDTYIPHARMEIINDTIRDEIAWQ